MASDVIFPDATPKAKAMADSWQLLCRERAEAHATFEAATRDIVCTLHAAWEAANRLTGETRQEAAKAEARATFEEAMAPHRQALRDELDECQRRREERFVAIEAEFG